eukprot:jgi/Phyca11/104497/e_gw1.9.729.1
MPPRVSWRELAVDVDAVGAEVVFAKLKAFDIEKSQVMGCTICPGGDQKMRYRLLECGSTTCREASPVKCPWRGKVVTCLESEHASVYDSGEHNTVSCTSSPVRKKLTQPQKAFVRDLAQNHLRPMRIRHALARKFATPLEELPALKTVQNFVNHYARSRLENHDRVEDLKRWIRHQAYDHSKEMTEPFTFTWEMDNEGLPLVGNGSDRKPFLVGISTKALMLRLMVPPESFILHLDSTYKTNRMDYPVLVVGVSDRSRRFHLVAMFIMSQETEPIFRSALLSLRRLYFWMTDKHLTVQYAMADGDRAQFNALSSVFGENPRFCFLMCFFHVMKHIQERVKMLSSDSQARVLTELYDLHFARDQAHYMGMLRAVLHRWMTEATLTAFAQYFYSQWVVGPFGKWQRFATPSGFASTNNPAETFNALLKRDYTLRPFEYAVIPAPTLARRVSEMVREGLLGLAPGQNVESVRSGECSILRVISLPARRVSVAPNRRSEEAIAVSAQMGSNYARKEYEGEPFDGWPVNIQLQSCPCDYFFGFGACVHVLYALRVTAHVDSSGREVLVSRRKIKRGAVAVLPDLGRPRDVGPALSFE